jgi:hypothetical protein
VAVLLELVVEDLLAGQAEPVPAVDGALRFDLEGLTAVLEAGAQLDRVDVVIVVHNFAPDLYYIRSDSALSTLSPETLLFLQMPDGEDSGYVGP